jgi:hypothetical protein
LNVSLLPLATSTNRTVNMSGMASFGYVRRLTVIVWVFAIKPLEIV